jgi:hypothetical protein
MTLQVGLPVLIGGAFFALAARAWAQSYSLTTNIPATSFTAGSTGYSALGDVPSPAVNLLSAPSTTLTLGTTGNANEQPIPTNGTGTALSGTWGLLTDGSYGIVPISGTGGPGEIEIGNSFALTFAAATSLSTIDVFSGWGDAGRSAQSYTISYALASNPTSFATLSPGAVGSGANSGIGINGEWTKLALTGMSNVIAIRFNFNTQQNGYVGYTQLAVMGTTTTSTPLTWTGGSNNGSWDTTSTNNWINSSTFAISGSSVASNYADTDAVTFADNATNTATLITIQTGGVAPSAVYFTNDVTAYSLTNTGSDTNGITDSPPCRMAP